MSGKSDRAKDTAGPAEAAVPDFDQFAQNMGRLVEEYGKVTAAYLKPLERGEAKTGQADEASEMVKTLGRVAEKWVSDPRKIIEPSRAMQAYQVKLGSLEKELPFDGLFETQYFERAIKTGG